MPKISKAALNYEAWKQKQAVIGQLNQLKQRGFTDDDIRSAGPNAWQTLQGKTPRTPPQIQYTIRDGDDLNKIASQFGMDPKSLLDANPDMQAFRTGMVINVKPPPVYSQAQLQNMAQQPRQYFLGFDVTRANMTAPAPDNNPFRGYWFGIPIGNPAPKP